MQTIRPSAATPSRGIPALRWLPPLEGRDVALALGPLVAGTAVGIMTNADGTRWYRRLSKPSWTPPDAAFGPVWSVLYLLMGTAAAIVARAGRERLASASAVPARRTRLALALFAGQLALNLLWSIVFFAIRRPRSAGIEIGFLWASIAATMVAFLRVRVVAGLLLLPYLAWTTFAGLLNAEIIRRNPRA